MSGKNVSKSFSTFFSWKTKSSRVFFAHSCIINAVRNEKGENTFPGKCLCFCVEKLKKKMGDEAAKNVSEQLLITSQQKWAHKLFKKKKIY